MHRRLIQSGLGLAALAAVTILSVGRTPPDLALHPAADDVVQLSMLALAQADPIPGRRVAGRAEPEPEAKNSSAQPRRARGDSMSSETIDRCLEVARDIDGDLSKELMQKRLKNPEEFAALMTGENVGRRLWAMAQLKQRDPDLYRHKISEVTQALQINRVAAQLYDARQSSDQGKINALTEQLRNLLQIQFALSMKSRCEYLSRLEDQAKALREEIDRDAGNFNKIIEDRMAKLLEQPPQADVTAVIPAAHQPLPNQPAPRSSR